MDSKRVLSIQSHVVYGYVGNKSATFPLQLSGFDVDCINTVQYSNHTGHKIVKGSKTTSSQIADVFEGLFLNNLISKYSYLITGYCPTEEVLETLNQQILKLKNDNPNLFYTLDPVMGESGRLYVPKEQVPIYKKMLKSATLVTPNKTEFEILSEIKLVDISEIKRGMKFFHDKGVSFVVLTSMEFENDVENLHLYASEKIQSRTKTYVLKFPKIKGYFSGTGDLFSSLMVKFMHEFKDDKDRFRKSIENCVATIEAVIKTTIKLDPENNTDMKFKNELAIIQSKNELESSSVKYQAQEI